MESKEFEAGPWRMEVTRSHILKSSCEKGKEEGCELGRDACTVCRYPSQIYVCHRLSHDSVMP